MKTLTLKEAQALYTILEESQAAQQATLVEPDGQLVRILVPADEYAAFLAWRKAEQERQQQSNQDQAFRREAEAFEQMKPELLRTHPGQAVAIYQGKIVAVGATKAEVYEQVTDRFGEAPVFIHIVQEHARVYKMPYRKVIR